MSDLKLDQQLRVFLEETERDRAEGNTIANLRLETHQLRTELREVATEQRLMKMRLDRHGRDIRELKTRLEWDGEEEMDTGQHQVDDLKRHLAVKEAELKDRRDSTIWWKRQKWQWLVGAIGALVMLVVAALGSVIWFLVQRSLGK